jgi:1,2-diacylglycerol 3-alpha-glucosyltransferase
MHRIAIVSIFTEEFGGGEARILYELARRLATRHEVLVVCPGEHTERTRDAQGLDLLTVESSGLEEVRFPNLTCATRARVFELLDAFAPDVVHAHNPVMLGLLSLVWARTRGVPFVTTPHFIPDRILEFPSGARALLLAFRAITPLVNAYLGTYLRHCDAIIALNRAVAAGTARFTGHGPIAVIPNGRDLAPLAACRIPPIDGDKRTLCFIGYLAQRKNQMYLLRMLALLPATYRLVLVGRSLVPRYERALRSYAMRHSLANVEFLGGVDNACIPSILEQAHVLVSASILEAQSLVVIEALASGTPVVGLANETIDELVDDLVGRRLPADAPPAAFAEAVLAVCGLARAEYEEMARQARARVQRMGWDPVVCATVGLYDSVAARSAEPGGAATSRGTGLSRTARIFAAVTNVVCLFLFGAYGRRRIPAPGG